MMAPRYQVVIERKLKKQGKSMRKLMRILTGLTDTKVWSMASPSILHCHFQYLVHLDSYLSLGVES